MRNVIVLMVTVVVFLVGCAQQEVQTSTDTKLRRINQANEAASKISQQHDWWKLTKKEGGSNKDVGNITLTFNDNQLTLDIDKYHKFLLEYEQLTVGDKVNFIHMAHLGGSVEDPASYLAPNTEVAREYFSQHYDGAY